jgi:Holliday junction resolvasome RuvABC ATP-dependent DNA helicase subunit
MSEMIDFRCNQLEIKNPFDDEAIAKIWDVTKGVPRHALKICEKCVGYMEFMESTEITEEMIEAAAQDAGILELEDE